MTTDGSNPAWSLVALAVLMIGNLLLAADGRHHWDEAGYLYAGAYAPTAEIIDGQVQPSGIPHFMQGRILHVLIVKGVMSLADSSMAGFRAMIALDLASLAVSVWLVFLILRELIPDVRQRCIGIVLVAASPVVLYLAFKTLADSEALLAALVATLSLVRIARGGGLHHAAIATLGLGVAALCKNQMVVLPAAGWAALCIVQFGAIDRRRLAVIGAASGLVAVALTIAVLHVLGISLGSYLASYGDLTSYHVSPIAKVLSIGTEFGVIWLLLPFAFLSSRRRELSAFVLWFLFAMAPFVLLINSIEARHVAVNLVAASGLIALALEALAARFRWGEMSKSARGAVGVLAVIVLLAGNALTLAIMPHRVNTVQMRALLDCLDARYGEDGYVLLTSAGYTDFQMIRVLWPKIDVRDASTAIIAVHEGPRSRSEALHDWLGGRYHDSVGQLREIGSPIVYMGYHQTFAAENLHAIVSAVSPSTADLLLNKVDLKDRLYPPATAWLWQSAEVKLELIAEVGHYHAFEVKLTPP